MTVWRQISIALFFVIAIASPASAQSEGPQQAVTQQVILERMSQARLDNRNRFRPYVVTRDYALFEEETKAPRSKVTAEVSFVPPSSKQYKIVERSGSGLGERLVRRMLDGETTIVKENGLTDLTTSNYDFQMAGEEKVDGRRSYVLKMFPKRKDKTLLRGTVWVDAETFLLHRMEGEPAKSPSWWLRNTHITFFYSDVEGMWLQTASEFTTHVRVFGRHQMVAHDVKYKTEHRPTSAGLRGPSVLAHPKTAAKQVP